MADLLAPDVPRLALSIMQPWAWLIVHGHKSIENRNWKPWNPGLKFRGPVAIHAGKLFDKGAHDDVLRGRHPVTGEASLMGAGPAASLLSMLAGKQNGGIVGVGEITGIVTQSDDEWFVGPYGIVIANARPVEFIPVTGALGFFDWRAKLAGAAA